jgi:hypothetical protein
LGTGERGRNLWGSCIVDLSFLWTCTVYGGLLVLGIWYISPLGLSVGFRVFGCLAKPGWMWLATHNFRWFPGGLKVSLGRSSDTMAVQSDDHSSVGFCYFLDFRNISLPGSMYTRNVFSQKLFYYHESIVITYL